MVVGVVGRRVGGAGLASSSAARAPRFNPSPLPHGSAVRSVQSVWAPGGKREVDEAKARWVGGWVGELVGK